MMVQDTALLNCDLKIVNATIYDGVTDNPFEGGVAVHNGVIIAVGDVSCFTSVRTIDVKSAILCPGFIDVHTHDDLAVIETPELQCKVSQGVTSIVVGNCGVSLAPLTEPSDLPSAPFGFLGPEDKYRYSRFADYLDEIDAADPAVNVFALVGHTTLRAETMGNFDRAATSGEIEKMCLLLSESLKAGAIGLSTGLAYPPAINAPTSEVIELAKVVGEFGAIYATHVRDEADGVISAVKEAIEIADVSSSRLIISHHKCIGRENWGKSKQTLRLIDNYTKSSPAAMDVYPYTASSTALLAHKTRFAERVVVTESAPHPEMAGRELSDICSLWGCASEVAVAKLSPAKAVYHNMSEDDLQRILRHPLSMVASDGMPSDKIPHPRLWGTFPRLFKRYVRELGTLSVSEAIRKITSQPADNFGLKGRGKIEVGFHADITVFDLKKISDEATFEHPSEQSVGIRLVFRGGVETFCGS